MQKKIFSEGSLVVYLNKTYYLWAITENEVILLNRDKLRPLFIKADMSKIMLKDY